MSRLPPPLSTNPPPLLIPPASGVPPPSSSLLSSTPLPTTPTTTISSSASILHNPSSHPRPSPRRHPSREDRPEQLWTSMQQKLSEVELSTNTPIFFNTGQAVALEELRIAQIGLAQAWMVGGDDVSAGVSPDTPAAMAGKSGLDGGKDGVAGIGGGMGKGGAEGGKGGLGKELVSDALLAKKRRAANDAHFERVEVGVKEVAGKLEAVAMAMGMVERESRRVWESESESGSGGLEESESEVGG